eukprot:6044148-Pleurochrysis_carterae.AAC.1
MLAFRGAPGDCHSPSPASYCLWTASCSAGEQAARTCATTPCGISPGTCRAVAPRRTCSCHTRPWPASRTSRRAPARRTGARPWPVPRASAASTVS